jgi:MraZ protein
VDNELTYFYGRSQSRISGGGQVAFPKRFRDALGADDRLVILPGAQNCLYIYPYRQFALVRERAKNYAERLNDPEFLRDFLEEVCQLELDTQGRFVLTKELRARAEISGAEALFIGMDDRIEIWAPEIRERLRAKDFAARRSAQAREIFGI